MLALKEQLQQTGLSVVSIESMHWEPRPEKLLKVSGSPYQLSIDGYQLATPA